MKTQELRELTKDELSARRRELKMELLHMRIQQASGQLENPARIRFSRKEIARIETILNERALNINLTPSAPKTVKAAPAVSAAAESEPQVKKAARKTAGKPAARKSAAKKAAKTKAAEA